MQAVGFILFIGIGFVQLAATMAGLEQWLGLPWLLAAFISVFLAWFPIIGSILGMFGAVDVWGWSWLAAGALFFGVTAIGVVLAMGAGIAEFMSRRRASS